MSAVRTRPSRRFVSRLATMAVLPLFVTAHAQPAADPVAAKPEFRVQQVRPGLAVLLNTGGNVAVWSGPEGVVLVDDGLAGHTPQLLEAIARISRAPIRFVINTHWHPDHTGGNEALAGGGATVIAHESVRARLSQPQAVEEYDAKVPAAPAAALPVITFAESLAIHVNGDRLNVVHVAGAHTDGDVIVRWRDANVVHMGDLFYNGGYPFIDLANGGSLAGVVASLEGTLARSDAQTIVIPGHGPVATRADLAAYRDMLVAVGRKVREAVEAGRSVDEVLASRPTADFDDRYANGAVNPERFVRVLYRDLSTPRSAR